MNISNAGRGLQVRTLKGSIFLAIILLVIGWLLNTPGGLLGKADAVGYAVCHRIDLRSFHLGDRQLPLCARCTGMYLGAMLGLVYQGMTAGRSVGKPSRGVILVLGLMVLAFAVDGINSYASLFPGVPTIYEPHNTGRLLTGTGMGLAIAAALFPAFNLSVWNTVQNKPALDGWRPLAGLIALGGLLDLIVLSENPLALYPLALISAAGVLVLVTMIYAMIWLMIFRQEGSANRAAELLLPLAGGFALGMIQIILLDLGRFVLTGSWDGFHLG
jgi:uncharacterized membrane protein